MAFATKQQAMNMRAHSWACLDCGSVYSQKQTSCSMCRSERLQYFASKAELRRFCALKLQVKAGLIMKLELQPDYLIAVNGQKICHYRADFRYIRMGVQVVEDVKGTKNEKHLDGLFKLKRKLVEAIYGIEITVVTA